MRPVAKLYREFCLRTAQMLEEEANRYARHPGLQDEHRQFIHLLRQQCREWRSRKSARHRQEHSHSIVICTY